MTFDELMSILMSLRPSYYIRKNEDAIFEMIPELKECKGFEQHSKWHIYDVYEHILHVIENVPCNSIMRLAALFHDLGKPATYVLDEQGRGHFPNHNVVSLKIFHNFAEKYIKYDKETIDIISKLIYYHDFDFNKKNYEIKDAIDDIGYYYMILLFRLKEADLKAQSPEFHYLLDEYKKQYYMIMASDNKRESNPLLQKRLF